MSKVKCELGKKLTAWQFAQFYRFEQNKNVADKNGFTLF